MSPRSAALHSIRAFIPRLDSSPRSQQGNFPVIAPARFLLYRVKAKFGRMKTSKQTATVRDPQKLSGICLPKFRRPVMVLHHLFQPSSPSLPLILPVFTGILNKEAQ